MRGKDWERSNQKEGNEQDVKLIKKKIFLFAWAKTLSYFYLAKSRIIQGSKGKLLDIKLLCLAFYYCGLCSSHAWLHIFFSFFYDFLLLHRLFLQNDHSYLLNRRIHTCFVWGRRDNSSSLNSSLNSCIPLRAILTPLGDLIPLYKYIITWKKTQVKSNGQLSVVWPRRGQELVHSDT